MLHKKPLPFIFGAIPDGKSNSEASALAAWNGSEGKGEGSLTWSIEVPAKFSRRLGDAVASVLP